MALPGHSPPPFTGPGSPSRPLNHYDAKPPVPTYGSQPRPMLPPSPQHFAAPRYASHQPPPPAHSPPINSHPDLRNPPFSSLHKRPGSSMSISSMLGAEPAKTMSEQYQNHASRTPSRQNSISGPPMSLSNVMSPSQYSSMPSHGENTYMTRSRTPDRTGNGGFASRPQRSNSGSMMPRPGLLYDHQTQNMINSSMGRYGEQIAPQISAIGNPPGPPHDPAERARRTSISGLLQRPESQPLNNPAVTRPSPSHGLLGRLENTAMPVASGERYVPTPRTDGNEATRTNGVAGVYETRPPPMTEPPRPAAGSILFRDVPPATSDKSSSQSASPELRRSQINGSESRGLAGLLNQPSEMTPGAQAMARQDSVQSQGDRSIFGDRARFRPYSPFAGSIASQNLSVTSAPAEEQGRKGSDEISQHRALLSLAAESKRGRYSPVPQVVQGAQAQTPVPDRGVKTEQGRVFAGLGGGMSTTSAGPTPTPGALPTSPFRREDGGARLSEENLMKMSRSTSGISKRPRKVHDEEGRAESDTGDLKKMGPGRGNKRGKYAHSYKLDLEDTGAVGQRRNAPQHASSINQRAMTPINAANNSQSLGSLQHQLQQQIPALEQPPIYRVKRIVRVGSVLAAAKLNPRRHLGNFRYNPTVSAAELPRSTPQKFNISIRPNLLPSFYNAEQVNCTYKIRVPHWWLRKREREIICKEARLWGTGIYSDDSDPIVAAMHSGFLHTPECEGVDETLLDRVIKEDNTKIEGLDYNPGKPIKPEDGKSALITLLVLPCLDSYVATTRFGIKSREWPGPQPKNAHDGVSFMVLNVEMVQAGLEEWRLGRTGQERRKRLNLELEERSRGLQMQKERIEKAKMRLRERKRNNHFSRNRIIPPRIPSVKSKAEDAKENTPTTLDIGQAPEDWIRQAAGAAA